MAEADHGAFWVATAAGQEANQRIDAFGLRACEQRDADRVEDAAHRRAADNLREVDVAQLGHMFREAAGDDVLAGRGVVGRAHAADVVRGPTGDSSGRPSSATAFAPRIFSLSRSLMPDNSRIRETCCQSPMSAA